MKTEDSSEVVSHTLVCTNERPNGKACCQGVGGLEFYFKLKEKIKAEGYYNTHWITRTGCLGFCNNVGPVVAIHRKGQEPVFYSEINTEAEFETIWEEITRTK